MTKNCPFCKLKHQKPSSAFRRLFPDTAGVYEIVGESENFFVVLDAAPLTEGHSLIVSKSHLYGMYQAWPSRSAEIQALQTRALGQIKAAWGTGAILCEHGSLNGQKDARCIQHAHIHVIPSVNCLAEALSREEGIELRKIRDYGSFPNPMTRQYFILRDCDGQAWGAFADDFPSQLIRQVFAKQNRLLSWNWRDYVDMPVQLKTRDTISAAHNKFQSIPAGI